ncbi:hypothetical protein QJS10_CPB13g01054 [Acorus calamus]|uniref:O-fucosyltransferase family protein n=1 Tax=Acorus calamus TaxID=4465 RepID=A0AAV9DJH9_ACOCL|nr:hypothetical protein QJS10_CPB13g01054 [Acorus calamus]
MGLTLQLGSKSTNKWRKRTTPKSPITCISLSLLSLIIISSTIFIYRSRTQNPFTSPKPISLNPPRTPTTNTQCCSFNSSERFLFYAPHSGFSNQVSELRWGLLMAAILNRTLVVPPILDHHAVALGSCPKFRVADPSRLRMSVWDHSIDLAKSHRYISMGDIVDLSSLVSSSTVRIIDFRVFASQWCGLSMDLACSGSLCCSMVGSGSSSDEDFQKCGSLLSGMDGNIDQCLYAVEEDCRTTVWTYQQEHDETLDPYQLDELLKRKKKVFYVRRRRDVYKALGPGSKAETATVLAFGTLFTSPYKNSELYIDIKESPKDARIQSVLENIKYLPFVPEILDAGKDYVKNHIRNPFLCAQLRLLDGQFKNHWKATFSALEQKLQALQLDHKPVHIFIMTDLPSSNWTGNYLGELASKSDSYKLYILRENDEVVVRAAEKVMAAEHGVRSGILSTDQDGMIAKNSHCSLSVRSPDLLLHVEETVCSCATLGFIGTAGSTIAESIELMRKNGVCSHQSVSK